MEFNSAEEVLSFSQHLEDSCIIEARNYLMQSTELTLSDFSVNSDKTYKGKGAFGDYLEEQYFGKKNDNKEEPDIRNLGIEIKAVPLLPKDENFVVKERLVLGKINFRKMDQETFNQSQFVHKDSVLLLVFNVEDFSPDYGNRLIKLVDLWRTLEHDLPQIQSDWETIYNKIHSGNADKISEGDTLLLGACTKGSTAEESMQEQPHSEILAKGRALCFKKAYIQSIYERLFSERRNRDKILQSDDNWRPIQDIVQDKISSFIGLNGIQLCQKLEHVFNPKDKSIYARMSRWMLGLNSENDTFEEFRDAGIQIKSIRIEANGNIKEAMSFKNVPFCEIINEEWEDSIFYEELTSKFFFFVFKKYNDTDETYTFDRVIYWNMPESDIDKAHFVWEDTKNKIQSNDYSNFVLETTPGFEVAHVRPKGTRQNPYMRTPQGQLEKKKCFWLNRNYIKQYVIS